MNKALLTLTLLTFTFFFSNLSAQTISTVAGNGLTGFSGDGGQATAADLDYTADVAFDASGNMYVVDDFNNRLRKVDNTGMITTIAGTGTAAYTGNGGPATAATLHSPSGVDIDANGNIYIVDQENNAVRIINTSGIINTFAGTGTQGFSGDGGQATNAQLSQPDKMAIDRNTGNIYIADYTNDRIRMVNTNGVITTVAGNGSASFSGDGGQATAAGLSDPVGVFIDNSGNMYIGDYANNRVRMVNTLGIISTIVGNGTASSTGDGGPATAATVNNPAGILVDNWGNIYVNEFFGHRIRMINSSGTISTLAGTGSSGYTGDGGPATAATMSDPYGIRMDVAGNIYFADLSNSVVREISGIPLGVNKINTGNNFTVYPNPTNGMITLQLSAEKQSRETVVEVYNMLGEKVYSKQFTIYNPDSYREQFTIDLSGQPNGIYLLKLQSADGSVITKKIEISR